jgi:hypothetical protein
MHIVTSIYDEEFLMLVLSSIKCTLYGSIFYIIKEMFYVWVLVNTIMKLQAT